MDERTAAGRGRPSSVGLGAVIAVAAAIGFVVWLLVRGGDHTTASPVTTGQTTTSGGRALGPIAASRARLHALSVEVAHPIYWVGAKPKKVYELTRTSSDRIFIRYLPRGVPVGIRSSAFTIVGTYPVPNALKVLTALAKKPGEHELAAPGGGFAVYELSHPTNVYLAYPGSNLQIEVFDPSPRRARRLVTSGRVAPVG